MVIGSDGDCIEEIIVNPPPEPPPPEPPPFVDPLLPPPSSAECQACAMNFANQVSACMTLLTLGIPCSVDSNMCSSVCGP
jgi:hypothetical protein